MAWLQNLAGKAEDLLNKIDQNAATVLNENGNKNNEDTSANLSDSASYHECEDAPQASSSPRDSLNDSKPYATATDSTIQEFDTADSAVIWAAGTHTNDNSNVNPEELLTSDDSTFSSAFHGFDLTEEVQAMSANMDKLTRENKQIQRQLLNMYHMYAQLRNENFNLQNRLEIINEQLQVAQAEKEQCMARAQRILQDKEKLLSLQKTRKATQESAQLFATYNHQIKKELEFHQKRADELQESNHKLNSTLQSLQAQHKAIQTGLKQNIELLEENLKKEIKSRKLVEDEYKQKNKELDEKLLEIKNLQNQISSLEEKIKLYEKALSEQRSAPSTSKDLESNVKSLTDALMRKQNTLEKVTTERNALRLQLERLEQDYRTALHQLQRSQANVLAVPESETRSEMPQFMRISPRDALVTRRVKQTYSILNSISIRTGVFFRRHPIARVFVFIYVVLIHIWAVAILFSSAPN